MRTNKQFKPKRRTTLIRVSYKTKNELNICEKTHKKIVVENTIIKALRGLKK